MAAGFHRSGIGDTSPAQSGAVSEEEFEAALNEVTGCAVGGHSLQRLLEDRRRDRERDEAWLEARQRERRRG